MAREDTLSCSSPITSASKLSTSGLAGFNVKHLLHKNKIDNNSFEDVKGMEVDIDDFPLFTKTCAVHNTLAVQYSTVQYSTVQYSTVQYSTAQHSTAQYNTNIGIHKDKYTQTLE